jgi:hypothetical protein
MNSNNFQQQLLYVNSLNNVIFVFIHLFLNFLLQHIF